MFIELLRTSGLAIGACALAALHSSCSDERGDPGTGSKRVLLVVTDATHAAHLGSYGCDRELTPSIDKLAAQGVRFDRAFSNNTWTLPSTASLFTGLLQEHHGAVTNHHRLDKSAATMAEQFQRAGWNTAAFVQMAYASAKFGFDQGFDSFRYYGEGQPGRAGQTIPQTLKWLDSSPGEKWFLYLHLRRPHSPYIPNLAKLKRLDKDCSLAGGERNKEFMFADVFGARSFDEPERAHIEHLYQANLATTDALLTGVFQRARKQGALIVVTSDHGEALGQHGVFGHGANLWAESIDIPLIFWWPGIQSRVSTHPASTIDVWPTIFDLTELGRAGGDRPDVDGDSLYLHLHAPMTPSDTPIVASGRYTLDDLPKVAVIQNDWKLIRDPDGSIQLFDRTKDRVDRFDVSENHPDVVDRLSTLAANWQTENRAVAQAGARHDGMDDELSSDLEALGYIEDVEDE